MMATLKANSLNVSVKVYTRLPWPASPLPVFSLSRLAIGEDLVCRAIVNTALFTSPCPARPQRPPRVLARVSPGAGDGDRHDAGGAR